MSNTVLSQPSAGFFLTPVRLSGPSASIYRGRQPIKQLVVEPAHSKVLGDRDMHVIAEEGGGQAPFGSQIEIETCTTTESTFFSTVAQNN